MHHHFPDFGLTPEQRREAVFGHRYEHPGMHGARGEIWCYTDAFSYAPGVTARLHVSSTAERYRLAILRDGAAASPVLERAVASLGRQRNAIGEVFHAGSCEWVAALLRRDAMVERVTANVLRRYLGR